MSIPVRKWIVLLTLALVVDAAAGAVIKDDETERIFRDRLADGGDGPEMMILPPGSFHMGSRGTEEGRAADEGPRREVIVDGQFALSRREVTVGEFRRFVEDTGYRTDAERDGGCFYWSGDWLLAPGKDWQDPPGFEQDDRHPVVCVSWNDAGAFARWMADRTGKAYRLPTEAEWEYAARGGTDSARPWGNAPDEACREANVADLTLKESYPGDWPAHPCRDGYAHTAPVASLGENPFGLWDMLGNVWEWTCSRYEQRYGGVEQHCADALERGPRVYRGGSWYNFPDWVRSAARAASSPSFRAGILGFRLARDL